MFARRSPPALKTRQDSFEAEYGLG